MLGIMKIGPREGKLRPRRQNDYQTTTGEEKGSDSVRHWKMVRVRSRHVRSTVVRTVCRSQYTTYRNQYNAMPWLWWRFQTLKLRFKPVPFQLDIVNRPVLSIPSPKPKPDSTMGREGQSYFIYKDPCGPNDKHGDHLPSYSCQLSRAKVR